MIVDWVLVGIGVGYAVVLLLCVWTLLAVRRIKARVDSIGSTRPIVPTNHMLQYWRKRMSQYPPGSPKYRAYHLKLIEAAKDGD